jgi:hypothetical protein
VECHAHVTDGIRFCEGDDETSYFVAPVAKEAEVRFIADGFAAYICSYTRNHVIPGTTTT